MKSTRYSFASTVPSRPRLADKANIADAALRARALAALLEHFAEPERPFDDASRFERIRASRDLAERVRVVAL